MCIPSTPSPESPEKCLTMVTRLTRWLLLVTIGSSTAISYCYALNYTIQYNVAEKFNEVVGVNRDESVNLCCPIHDCMPRLAFIGHSKYVFDLENGCHEIKSFTGSKQANYQCECARGKSIRWNSVQLRVFEPDVATLSSEIEENWSNARGNHSGRNESQLLRFGTLGNHSMDIQVTPVWETCNMTKMKIPARGRIKLKCGIVPKIGMTFFWSVIRWNGPILNWFEVNEYKRSELRLDELIAVPGNRYACHTAYHDRASCREFEVETSGPFPFAASIEANSTENHTASMLSHVRFECGINAEAYNYVTWVKTAEHVSRPEVEVTDENIIQKSDVDDPSVYDVFELSREDEGYYTCYVMNGTTAIYRSHHLRVTEEQTYTTYIVAGVLCGTAICVLAVGVFVRRRSRQQVKGSMEQLVDVKTHRRRIVEIERPRHGDDERVGRPQLTLPIVRIKTERVIVDNNAAPNPEAIRSYEIPLDTAWELRREDLSNIESLDVGSSGRLMTARLANFVPGGPIEVMIKTLCGNPHNDDVRALVSEMETMKAIGSHVNIVSLIGACTQNGPLYVVMEFAKHGNLRSFLQQQIASAGYMSIRETGAIERKVPCIKVLASYARQVASGMQYLASRGCIHRDLAARNVLVCEGNLMKIADYAVLSEDDTDTRGVKGRDRILRVRWMAPETLFNNYCTIKANVWSYGILLWEIMTFADTPYPLFTSNMKLLRQLRRGYRMENPKNCPTEIYQLMLKCWRENAAERPMFEEIVDDLNRILEMAEAEYENVFDVTSNNQVNADDYCDVVRSSLYETVPP